MHQFFVLTYVFVRSLVIAISFHDLNLTEVFIKNPRSISKLIGVYHFVNLIVWFFFCSLCCFFCAEHSNSSCQLPPELCSIIMSPIPISTIYSFSLLPSVMHRIESLLIAANLKSVPMLLSNQNAVIPTLQVSSPVWPEKFKVDNFELCFCFKQFKLSFCKTLFLSNVH